MKRTAFAFICPRDRVRAAMDARRKIQHDPPVQ